MTFNTHEHGNCYICSPYNALVTYACEELAPVEPRALRAVLTMLVRAGGLGLRPIAGRPLRVHQQLADIDRCPTGAGPPTSRKAFWRI